MRRALDWLGRCLVVCSLVVPGLAEAQTTVSSGPERGDEVLVSGVVVDPAGEPLADVQVLLELSRSKFSLRRMGRVEGEALRLPTRTDADGRFALDWTWDPHYNTFVLAVGLDLAGGSKTGDGFEILERRDLTDAMSTGRVPELRIEVENAGFLRWLKNYLEGGASADEIRTYRDAGRPDQVRRSPHFPDESTWWYFDAGKRYRFVDGRFERMVQFTPIPDPPPNEG